MASKEHCRKRQFGFFKGIVKSRNDPSKQGNLKVLVPALSKRLFEAMPSHDLVHDFRIPPIGALVWIGFQDGLSHLPVWFWGWNKQGELEPETQSNYPGNIGLGPRLLSWGDMRILFNPDENDRRIEIKDFQETTSVILAPDDEVPISIKANGNILIESAQGSIIMRSNAVMEEALGDKVITTPDNIKIEAGRAVEINAIEEFTVTASNLIKLFGATTAEIGLEAGTIESDKRGMNSTATKTRLYHALKVLVEAVNNEIKADAKNTLEAATNEIKGTIQNILNAPINKIGSSNSTEPLILGLKLSTWLTAIVQALILHIHPTPAGPSSPSVDLTAALTPKLAEIVNLISKGNFTE